MYISHLISLMPMNFLEKRLAKLRICASMPAYRFVGLLGKNYEKNPKPHFLNWCRGAQASAHSI